LFQTKKLGSYRRFFIVVFMHKVIPQKRDTQLGYEFLNGCNINFQIRKTDL